MTLNLWILKDWLEEFSPSISCKNTKTEITGIRLYRPGMALEPHALYLGTSDMFFQDGGDHIVCKHQSDILTLQTNDFFSVFNRIQDAFSFYARWYNKCTLDIAAGCSLSDLLANAEEIFHAPIMVVDSAQILVAQSSDLSSVVAPEDWKSVTSRKSIPEEKLKQFNQVHKDSFYYRGIYLVPAGFFPTKSYCKHIFINDERLATVILKVPGKDPTPGTLHLLELFVPLVEKWIQANESNDSPFHVASHFAHILNNDITSLPALRRQLSLFGWGTECQMQLYVISSNKDQVHFDMRLNQVLANKSLGIYALVHQKNLVILCNLDIVNREALTEMLCTIMEENGYFGVSSFHFTNLSQLTRSYKQALIALEHSPQQAGKLYRCQDVAMRMVVKVVDEYTSASLLHPALVEIKAHDQQNKTEYYQTLFCFLKNERHHRRTAEELYIHRNTLFLRLEKIQELWPLDLDDNEERFYLLFSFYQDYYVQRAKHLAQHPFEGDLERRRPL